MGYTHSLLGGSGQLHSHFIISLKCERSSFHFLKYNSLLGPFISLKPRFHGLWNTKMWRAANEKWNPVTGNCWELWEMFSILCPHKIKSISEQWNLFLHTLSSPLRWWLLFGNHLCRKKVQFRRESPLGCLQGNVCNIIPFCVGRVHLTSEEPPGITEPITSLASGAKPRLCLSTLDLSVYICSG